MRPLILVLVVGCLAGCGGQIDVGDAGVDAGGPCTLSVSSYSTSCAVDSDCVAVFMGNACTSNCYCPNATIAASSKAQYEADFAASSHGTMHCGCPAYQLPLCCNGSCTSVATNGCDGGP